MQIYGGMAGAVEVIDSLDDAILKFASTHTLVLQYFVFDPASKDYVGTLMSYDGLSDLPMELNNPEGYTGSLLLANGEYKPQSSMIVGEHIRVKVVNAIGTSTSQLLNFGMLRGEHECTLNVLAYDGVYLKSPRVQKTIMLPPGGRADFAILCRYHGDYSLGTVMHGAEKFGGLVEPGHTILNLRVSPVDGENPATGLPITLPGPPEYYADLLGARPDGFNEIMLSNHAGDNQINGWPYNGSVSYVMHQGSIQEWHIFGGEGHGLEKGHPYHQHMAHFQIAKSDNDIAGVVGDYRDTVPVFRELSWTVRFVAPPWNGLMMIHCHITKHEDQGMMTLANITDPILSATPRHGPLIIM
jgi:FtsP/CotA-like multicopper oxidase with cupredoxin domain